MRLKIQLQSLNEKELMMELESLTALLNQLQIDLRNCGILTEKGCNIFGLMRQELMNMRNSVMPDR